MKRVLFVDDESLNLNAARRVVDALGSWNANYATNADEALALLQRQPFDCIVSDLNMPHISGLHLLREVRDRYPETVRMMFTASHPENCFALSSVAHQIWSKPWDMGGLLESLERIIRVRELICDKTFRRGAGQIDHLPSVPQIIMELTRVLATDSPSVRQIAAIIEQDPGISTKLLQLVNSAFFRVSRRIASIREAVVRLGINTIKNLVWSQSIYRLFSRDNRLRDFDIRELQFNSLLVARIAQWIFKDRLRKDEAFVSALLKNVGQLVLASKMPNYFGRVLKRARVEKRSIHSVERLESGVDHAAVGAYLLGMWGLPGEIVDAVAHQFEPRSVTDARPFDVADAVHVANCLVNQDSADQPTAELEVDERWLAELGVMTADLRHWRLAAQDALDTVQQIQF